MVKIEKKMFQHSILVSCFFQSATVYIVILYMQEFAEFIDFVETLHCFEYGFCFLNVLPSFIYLQ